MREILFRGQERRKGEQIRMDGTPVESIWVFGCVSHRDNDSNFSVIYPYRNPQQKEFDNRGILVYADTVGQYIGLTDKNGKKIFEGDIVEGYFDHKKIRGTVVYGSDCSFYIDQKSILGIGMNNAEDWVEVVGNIFDNPELLENA